MTSAALLKFPGNPRPIAERDESAIIVILPVVRIERDGSAAPHRKGRRALKSQPAGMAGNPKRA